MSRVGKDEVAAVFSAHGPLASAFEGYEVRQPQVEMAIAVWKAFATSRHAFIESGTGTGKSLAYLVPAVLWARESNEKVVVSTNTINLQEQLIHKDLPGLSRALGARFRFTLVKGRANYVCRRKLARVASEADDPPADPAFRQALAAVLSELPSVPTGSKSDFHIAVPQALWDQIASDSMSCLRARCPYLSTCYFARARAEMEQADILVTNHHLLFSDLALRATGPGMPGARVLPDYHYVIFDEAHNVPEVAAERLGRRASLAQMRKACQDLVRAERGRGRGDGRRGEGGLLASLRASLFRDADGEGAQGERASVGRLVDVATESVKRLRESVEWFFDSLTRVMDPLGPDPVRREMGWDSSREGQGERDRARQRAVRLKDELVASAAWKEDIAPGAERVIIRADEVARDLGSVLDSLADLDADGDERLQGLMAELQGSAVRISSEAAALDFVMRRGDETHVYWAEMLPNDVELVATPLDVGPILGERLFSQVESAVFTSATLTVRGEFGFFRKEVGLTGPSEPPLEIVFDSPFDFSRQALLAVACDLPHPQDPAFQDAAARAIVDIVKASRGRAFVLFTSMDMLYHTHEVLRAGLEGTGIPVFRQGDMPRHLMLTHFREKPGVLLGADSFWQGVDVPGEALSCVILVKLPFQVPTSPLVEAKVEAAEKAGSSGFYSYTLPSAVVRFRQGFGRLIRTREDRGVVVVLDKRLVEKRYGAVFLSSLPTGVECYAGAAADVVSRVRSWLG
ncbi:MAG TPA: DEAD/DEAH box helicase family protein [Firmicutes bacterium]|nr:DEAD/DEAH box helicase family protein [Bacillota bacterium]